MKRYVFTVHISHREEAGDGCQHTGLCVPCVVTLKTNKSALVQVREKMVVSVKSEESKHVMAHVSSNFEPFQYLFRTAVLPQS